MPRIWNLTSQVSIWTVIHTAESQYVILVDPELKTSAISLNLLNIFVTAPGIITWKCMCAHADKLDLAPWSQNQWTASAWAFCGEKAEVRRKPRNQFLPTTANRNRQNLAMSRNQRHCRKVFSLLLLKCPGYNQSYRKNFYILVQCGKGYLHFNMLNLSCQ